MLPSAFDTSGLEVQRRERPRDAQSNESYVRNHCVLSRVSGLSIFALTVFGSAARHEACQLIRYGLVLGRRQSTDTYSTDDTALRVQQDSASRKGRQQWIAEISDWNIFTAQTCQKRVGTRAHAGAGICLLLCQLYAAYRRAIHAPEADQETVPVAHRKACRLVGVPPHQVSAMRD